MSEQQNKLRKAAHQYLEQGWSIIPVGRDKRPLLGSWKQYQSERASHEQVEAWFAQYPEMNIGIVTGAISGIAVIDVEAGGSIENFPRTLTAKTGGLGKHLFYKHPGTEVKNGTRVAPLTDIRGDGGYVVAPPSISDKGSYEWIDDPVATEMAEYPVKLIEAIKNAKEAAPQRASGSDIERVPVGERNDAATRFVGSLFAKLPTSLWTVAGWGALKEWNATQTEEPLPERELRTTFESIRRRAMLARAEMDEDTPVMLDPLTLTQLYTEEFPPVLWLAEDLIPFGGVTAITGDSNSFKSFLTIALASSVAQGKPFLGHFNVSKGKVLIVDEENHRRFIRKRFEELGMSATDDILFLSQKGIKLDRGNYASALKEVLDKERPALVVLDSLVRFHSKEENSATEMATVMNEIRKLVGDDRAVVVVHHHKKERSFGRGGHNVRGSSDIFAALDCHIVVERKEDDSLLLSQNKLRIQRQLDPFKVSIPLTETGLNFVYDGADTSRRERVLEIAEEIKAALIITGNAMSKKDLLEELDNATKREISEAIKVLLAAGEIESETRAHGAHYYALADSSAEEDAEESQEEDVDLKPGEIPF